MQQRDRALALANETRIARAKIKADLKSGALDARDLLAEVPDVLMRVPVGEFLGWVPKVGPTKATTILRGGHDPRMILSPTIQLGRVSERTRRRIARVLPAPAAQRRAA